MADQHSGGWPDRIQHQGASIQSRLDSIEHQIENTQISPSDLFLLRQKLKGLIFSVENKLKAVSEDRNALVCRPARSQSTSFADVTPIDRDTHDHNRDTFCSTATTLGPSEESTPRVSIVSPDKSQRNISGSLDIIEPLCNNYDELSWYTDPTSNLLDDFCNTPKSTTIESSVVTPLNTIQTKAYNTQYSKPGWESFYTADVDEADDPERSSIDARCSILPNPTESIPSNCPDVTPNQVEDSDLAESKGSMSIATDSIYQTAELYSAWAGSSHSARVWPSLDKRFFCTFCAELGQFKLFERKADWKRHEEDFHYGLGLKWLCKAQSCSKVFYCGLDFKRHWKDAGHSGNPLKEILQTPRVYACGFDLEDCPQVYTEWQYRCNSVADVMVQKDCPEWSYDKTIRNLLKHRLLKAHWKKTFRSMASQYGISSSSQLHWTIDNTGEKRNQLENYTLVPNMGTLMASLFIAGLPVGGGAREIRPVSLLTSPNSLQSTESAPGVGFTTPMPLSSRISISQTTSQNLQTTRGSYTVAHTAEQAFINVPGNRTSTRSITMTDAWPEIQIGLPSNTQDDKNTCSDNLQPHSFDYNASQSSGFSANTTPQLPPPSTTKDINPTLSEHNRSISRRGFFRKKSMEFLKRSLPSIPSSHTMPPPSPPRS